MNHRWDLVVWNLENFAEGEQAELEIKDTVEGINVLEPRGEEIGGPVLGFKNVQSELGVVVKGIDDNLQAGNLEHGRFGARKGFNSRLDKLRDQLDLLLKNKSAIWFL